MPSACCRTILTSRDQEILRALLSLGPLTPSQLLAWSGTLGTPFRTEHRTRSRLRRLTQAGWVRAFPYATTSQGMLHYYKITRQGFRLLLGETATVPRAHFFRAVGLSRHPHTRMLADVFVHTLVCAHRDKVVVENLSAENALQIDIGDRRLLPDAAFDLVTGQGRRFHLFVEIDNGTEPLRARLFRHALFGNIGSLACFQAGPTDAEILCSQLGVPLHEQDLLTIPRYHAYFRLLIEGQPTAPFSMRTLPVKLPRQWDRRLTTIRRTSRHRYNRPVHQVQREIAAVFGERANAV
jgi:hypothetical protein